MKFQSLVIKWLLNHDPAQRPTSKELIQSEHLPPPQMEEAELNEILRSTISDPHSKSYRRMIHAMFSQTINAADDLMYDSDVHKVRSNKRNIFMPSDILVKQQKNTDVIWLQYSIHEKHSVSL